MTLIWSRAMHAGRWRGRGLAASQLWKTRRYECRALGWMDGAVATTDADAAALRDMAPTIPFGPWQRRRQRLLPARAGPLDGRTLVFLGNMHYHANVASVLDFVRRVMPLVWGRHPAAGCLSWARTPRPRCSPGPGRPHHRDRLREGRAPPPVAGDGGVCPISTALVFRTRRWSSWRRGCP